MNVILEGPDGSGKSTLAKLIAQLTGLPIQEGSGPPRRPGEIEDRLERYLGLDGRIFDRHPAVSQPIYARIRGEALSPRFQELVSQFYQRGDLLVYCRATSPDRHVVKEGENPEHIRKLTDGYSGLVEGYDQWAVCHAQLIYRIRDSGGVLVADNRVVSAIEAAVR